MTRIHVSPAQLDAAAHRFRASAHEVRSAARQMRAALEAAPWQGVARNRFGDRFREWEAEAERTAAALEDMAHDLAYVARLFEEADRNP